MALVTRLTKGVQKTKPYRGFGFSGLKHLNRKKTKRRVLDFLECSHHKLPMKSYIETLQAQAATLQNATACTVSRSPDAQWEPLEIQIKRWWANLPPIMQQRSFQIVEIAAQCKGRYRDKPALREVASALRALSWTENRDWSSQGRNRRYWIRSC